ncbi:hypothetical protein ATY81_22450 [Rhizobium sp. R72]|uniref:DUF4174 domain-containing protein n=1 Tax=unclassified Rhizobium TaxID=2613769 RepID=UPI000B53156A|nr:MULTISPECIES: DUF4174 domain-containing protein [unclassified Rhizobium]OWW02425.1 hypothetical protein ATY81_22450 [Rhizobium sp. R72]OWW02559.1 hypothetical protein ATY80_22450 [Rhizobium sp. R711]
MLKSFLKEILGAPSGIMERCPSLLSFRNKCHVLVLFEGAADDRPDMQEDFLANKHDMLQSHDIALLRVAGGGVFSSLDNPVEIDADEIRNDLDGPSPEDFEAVLVDREGAVVFRSSRPINLPYLLDLISGSPGAGGPASKNDL